MFAVLSPKNASVHGVKPVPARKGLEVSCILVPVRLDVRDPVSLSELRADIRCAAHLVEKPDSACGLERFSVWIQPRHSLHYIELGQGDGSRLIISEEILYPLDQLSGTASGKRFVIDGPELHTRQTVAVQFGLEGLRIDPFRPEYTERECIAYPDVQKIIEFPADSCSGLIDCRSGRRDIRRWQQPWQTRIGIEHIPAPALHRDYSQMAPGRRLPACLAAVKPLLIDKPCQLADSKAIYIRYFILAYK